MGKTSKLSAKKFYSGSVLFIRKRLYLVVKYAIITFVGFIFLR